jgi:hypothetical protein
MVNEMLQQNIQDVIFHLGGAGVSRRAKLASFTRCSLQQGNGAPTIAFGRIRASDFTFS